MPAVIGNGRVDVNAVNVGVFEKFVEIGVAFVDAERVADGVELGLGALADGIHVGVWMPLINGDEFCAKTQTDNCDINFTLVHDQFENVRVKKLREIASVMGAIDQSGGRAVN